MDARYVMRVEKRVYRVSTGGRLRLVAVRKGNRPLTRQGLSALLSRRNVSVGRWR